MKNFFLPMKFRVTEKIQFKTLKRESWNQHGFSALLGLMTLVSLPAFATINILACEPEWGSLAQELGGDKVTVYNATNAFQDPHRIEAKPSLMAKARNADLLVCTGAELEIGWLPILLRQTGNPKIQPGQAGNFEAAKYVHLLDVPPRLDRAEGDVHTGGNPHIQTDPRNISLIADAMAKRLIEIDAANAEYYRLRHAQFSSRWKQAIVNWEKQATPLKGIPIVVQHKGFPYLENWLGLKQVAALESKPGVEPRSTYLSGLLGQLQRKPAKMVIRAAYNDARASEWLTERTNIPAVALPFTVGGSERAKDLFGLFDDTVQRLLSAAQ